MYIEKKVLQQSRLIVTSLSVEVRRQQYSMNIQQLPVMFLALGDETLLMADEVPAVCTDEESTSAPAIPLP